MRRVPPVTAIPSLPIPLHEWLHRDRMRGQDSHETMEVRPFSGHRHRRGKASPQGAPGRSTGPGKDTAGRSECGSDRTGRLAAPAYQSADRCLSSGRPETGVDPLTIGMMDQARRRILPLDGHGQCCDRQFRPHVIAHRPADDLPGEKIEHDGQIEPSFPSWQWSKKRFRASPPRTVRAPFSAYGSPFNLGPWP